MNAKFLITLYAVAALLNTALFFMTGYDWDKLIIAVLFVTIIINTRTIESNRERVKR